MKFLSVIGLATIAYLVIMVVQNIANKKSCENDYEDDYDGGWSDEEFERAAKGYREVGYDC